MLISIRLFLRGGEATGDEIKKDDITKKNYVVPTGITLDRFIDDLSIITRDGEIKSLAVKI